MFVYVAFQVKALCWNAAVKPQCAHFSQTNFIPEICGICHLQLRRHTRKRNHINITYSGRRPSCICDRNTYLTVTEHKRIDVFTAILPDTGLFMFSCERFQTHICRHCFYVHYFNRYFKLKCFSWRLKDQLDVTCYFISLLMCSTCFGH